LPAWRTTLCPQPPDRVSTLISDELDAVENREIFLAARQSPHQASRIHLHLHPNILLPFTLVYIDEMTAEEIKTLLNLEPHPAEGGSYRRTYASAPRQPAPRIAPHGHGDLLPAGAGNLLRDARPRIRRDLPLLSRRPGGDAPASPRRHSSAVLTLDRI